MSYASPDPISSQELLEKIQQLPPHAFEEVADFVDFLRTRAEERALTEAAAKLSEPMFARVWDNPEDAAYDRL